MTEKKRHLIVGDIHGCFNELMLLIKAAEFNPETDVLVSVGDLADRGPASLAVLELFANLQALEAAVVVRGNHDDKLFRYLKGNKVNISHGIATTIAELESLGDRRLEFEVFLYDFLKDLPLVYETDDFIAVHAAYREKVSEGHKRTLSLYGEVDGTKDEKGFPVRSDKWKHEYTGKKDIVHGHIVVEQAPEVFTCQSGAQIIDIDGGAVFGGDLCAIRYPDKAVFNVKALKVYHED